MKGYAIEIIDHGDGSTTQRFLVSLSDDVIWTDDMEVVLRAVRDDLLRQHIDGPQP